MNSELTAAEKKETHLEYRQEFADGAKYNLDRLDARESLRDVQGTDGPVQLVKSSIPPLW